VLPPEAGAEPERRSWGELFSWVITLVVLVGLSIVLWLLPHPELPAGREDPHHGAVTISDTHTIHVQPNTPFAKRLEAVKAEALQTEQPIVEVTGSVLAAIPATSTPATAAWEFATPELISTYSEWLQSDADVAFYQRQLGNTRSLTAKRLETQGAVVERLQRLVEVGSDSPRDLAQERANLMEGKLEADRQSHSAQADLNTSVRKQAALTRQLEQAGLEPDLLRELVPGRILIVAEVPESRMTGLMEKQRCSVRLYAAPDPALIGHVARILPTLSTAQRTLRLLVLLDTPSDAARPGMFADVGIGTEARRAVMVPQMSIVHVGREDYVLIAEGDDWRVTPVALGASQGKKVEVVKNLAAGATVLADGVVLLKPVIADVLQAESSL
jgi:multidrug efflux pump subunit AcrA (membrane-fusion protein)